MSSKQQYKDYNIRLKKEVKYLNAEVDRLRGFSSMLKEQNKTLRNPRVNPAYSWNNNKFFVGLCIGVILTLMVYVFII